MTLPNLAPVEALSDATLAQLAQRFASIGLVPKQLDAVVSAAGSVHPLLRKPVVLHHIRGRSEPFALAARALMFRDPIDESERDAAFGDLAAPLTESGWLLRTDAGYVSSLLLAVFDGVYVLTDDLSQGGDAVMGLGPLTSPLCAAAMPLYRVERALDLGCGAGTFGLLVARFADQVIATDINPRAIAMTRLNARLNGITNLEAREGSLFEPVKGERFDVIASQPPFVPQPNTGKSGSFMEGGGRGDELVLQLFNALVPHLSQRGRGVVMSEWGHGSTTPSPIERVEKALSGAGCDVLLFQFPSSSADTHAAEYAGALHPDLGPSFMDEAMLRRKHCAALALDAMVPTLTVVRRVDDRKARAATFAAPSLSHANRERVEELLLARDVVAGLDSLLDATVRFAEGVILREEQLGPGATVSSHISAVLPEKAMTADIPMSASLLRVGTFVHEASSVRAGIARYLELSGSPENPNELAKEIAHGLLSGVLVAKPGEAKSLITLAR